MTAASKLTRLAFIHPGWTVLYFMASMVLAVAGGHPDASPFLAAVLTAGSVAPLIVWLWALYSAGQAALMRRGIFQPDRGWVYPATIALLIGLSIVVSVTGKPLEVGGVIGMILAVPAIVAFGAPFWMAALAIELGGQGRLAPPLGKIAETSFLLFFYPFGAWVLHPRLLAIKAAIEA